MLLDVQRWPYFRAESLRTLACCLPSPSIWLHGVTCNVGHQVVPQSACVPQISCIQAYWYAPPDLEFHVLIHSFKHSIFLHSNAGLLVCPT